MDLLLTNITNKLNIAIVSFTLVSDQKEVLSYRANISFATRPQNSLADRSTKHIIKCVSDYYYQ